MEEDLVRMATELTSQANQMHEMQLELQKIATTTSQAEERGKVAGRKPALQSWRLARSRPRSKRRPNSRPVMLTSFGRKRTRQTGWTRRASEVETYLSVLAPGLLARPLLEWAAAFRDQPIVLSDVEAHEAAHGNSFDWNLKGVSEALGPLLHEV